MAHQDSVKTGRTTEEALEFNNQSAPKLDVLFAPYSKPVHSVIL